MSSYCACDGGKWGVTVCWSCYQASFELDWNVGEAGNHTFAGSQVCDETTCDSSEYEPTPIEESMAGELEDESSEESEYDEEAELLLEEIWDNMEENARFHESGWPYDEW